MIVSHLHRFIFIKTRKTAGTSVEIALSRHCGPRDIVTAVSPGDEDLRRQLGGTGPQNDDGAYNHMPARAVRRFVGRKMWGDYVTFTIERNPWDMVVSQYVWRAHGREDPPTFEEFVRTRLQTLERNSDIYRIRGRIAVDRVLRYERLDADLADLWRELDLPGSPALPHAKSGLRDSRHYRDYYTPDDAALVGKLFADVVETFGYRF